MGDSNFSLEGKIALITGGGRGIGAGIATSLARAGADVLVADYTQELAEEGASAIAALGRRTMAIQVDVRKPQSVSAMIDLVEKQFGRLDIAINNAGVVSLGGIEELTFEQWNDVIDVNLRGVFLCCQAEIKLMRKAKFGRIINTSSIAGKVGFPNLSHYSASKFGVIGLTNAIAKEVATDGITVNALCPGIVGTGMWRGESGLSALWAQPGESEEQSWARHQQVFLPQGVAQTPEDMGQMVVYLASAEHVTGQAMAVDGGFSL
ncbi:meso-butanediol dehydrogenase / (S,S)-butanediol dehydrogenase / diacetyl reductase [Agrobacterium fabrum]|jgi:meso-butanediol dehydrogenase/(S,S)-butanediol dehydrogenase/diacetyl reductase|uniref:Meso-butanediol dehydrogenase / (S,S)-butanediol dehydrogenase / diacetyl reductase n=1 Tax=Agrobacterium fabrum TaxID=1176649 RepID=A0A7Z7FTC0_9HYPH|nr:SDR family NAD(P)-dependent oxidoreductase [Agrobacterium fabrum]SDK34775.1 meso-butanediol dehydrogenase / (S,S)-butanediol dehydrogenase / diacetyl reductase [Agrobacterium fabrum]